MQWRDQIGMSASSRRPLRILGVGIVLTGAVLGSAGWLVLSAHRLTEHFHSLDCRLQELRGTILHFDEVLTMSAHMAAATGDPQWEERCQRFEPVLGDAISEAAELAPGAVDSRAATQTEEANHALVVMRDRVFDLVRQGDRVAAAQVLSSPEYERQKQIYADGMAELDAGLATHLQKHVDGYRHQITTIQVLGLVAMAFLMLGWIAVSAALRAHFNRRAQVEKALRSAHDQLESQVQDRTSELAAANDRLRVEIAERKQSEVRVDQARQMLENVAEGITDEVFLLSSDLQIIWANKPAIRDTGHDREDVVGQYCLLGQSCAQQPLRAAGRRLPDRGGSQDGQDRGRDPPAS